MGFGFAALYAVAILAGLVVAVAALDRIARRRPLARWLDRAQA